MKAELLSHSLQRVLLLPWRRAAHPLPLLLLLLLLLLVAFCPNAHAYATAAPHTQSQELSEPPGPPLMTSSRAAVPRHVAAFPTPVALRLTFSPVDSAVLQNGSDPQLQFAARVHSAIASSVGSQDGGSAAAGGTDERERVTVLQAVQGTYTNNESSSATARGQFPALNSSFKQQQQQQQRATAPSPALILDVQLLLAPTTYSAAIELFRAQAAATPALLVQDDALLTTLIKSAAPLFPARPATNGSQAGGGSLACCFDEHAAAAQLAADWQSEPSSSSGGDGWRWAGGLGGTLDGLSTTSQALLVAMGIVLALLIGWRVVARMLRSLRERRLRAERLRQEGGSAAEDEEAPSASRSSNAHSRLTLWAIV